MYLYVRAAIITTGHRLHAYHGDELVHVFEYRLPKD